MSDWDLRAACETEPRFGLIKELEGFGGGGLRLQLLPNIKQRGPGRPHSHPWSSPNAHLRKKSPSLPEATYDLLENSTGKNAQSLESNSAAAASGRCLDIRVSSHGHSHLPLSQSDTIACANP